MSHSPLNFKVSVLRAHVLAVLRPGGLFDRKAHRHELNHEKKFIGRMRMPYPSADPVGAPFRARALRQGSEGDAPPQVDSHHISTNPPSFNITPGNSHPLGPSPLTEKQDGKEVSGINFAIAAPNATAVTLCLFDRQGNALAELGLHKDHNTGVWNGQVFPLPLYSGVLYAYKIAGQGGWDGPFRWDSQRLLLDPYAPLVMSRAVFGVRDEFEKFEPKMGSRFLGAFDFRESSKFDWGDSYSRPDIPLEKLIVAEVPVRCFTAHPSSGLPAARRGTFLGVADKIPHLLDLGINAIELLPVFEYDELEFQRSPNARDHMTNIWGYSHVSFMAPMSRFKTSSLQPEEEDPSAVAQEFKEMVRRLHAAGIQVILDVVYNHTVEADDADPYLLSWRGIDAQAYYQQDPDAYVRLCNHSGCGNTIAANAPLPKQLILDSLKRWATEYHVDGFRFDLASCLCRDEYGRPLADPPLIREIAECPELSHVKLIAEPWDLGLFQVGTFPAHGRWAEWNGVYRDDVRKFIRGDGGMKAAFATRLAGSQDLYGASGRKPFHSINFVIAHDGFTLRDLVSYNVKHNEDNGEGNKDGSNDNYSWNCGIEGETDNQSVLSLRSRQARNLHLALMLSQGTPMMVVGDEYGQTRNGNNNWYGHDSDLTHFDWAAAEAAKAGQGESLGNDSSDTIWTSGWYRFYTQLIKFRRSSPLLGRSEFLSSKDITWHEDRWDDPESRFLAFTLHNSTVVGEDLYAAFNAHSFQVTVNLPSPPPGRVWRRLVDTNLPSPRDWTPLPGSRQVEQTYVMESYSAILLCASAEVTDSMEGVE